MSSYVVEFVFDYMVILADVNPLFAHVDENDIIEMAKENLIKDYGLDVEQFDIGGIVVHDKDN